MSFEIDSSLFPIPESQYAKEGPLPTKWALSILAFHLQIVKSTGNELTGGLKGDYFFGDSAVPLPRPATVLAWNKLVRLGRSESLCFVPPFLPSLRDEDEVGQAIAKRGTHIVSLSRRSGIHHRDSQHRINWGSVYTGNLLRNATADSILTGRTLRSNLVEAVISPKASQHPDSAQDSIRSRWEHLAVHGILSTKGLVFLPPVNRLMFRFLNHEAVARWALEYNNAYWLAIDDPESIDSDFKSLTQELVDASRNRQEESVKEAVEKVSRFGDMSGINI